MNRDRALLILQWALALVIVAESAAFAFSASAAHSFARTGMPDVVRLALAWSEMAAAILFLIPRATIAGGLLLIVVLLAAIALHIFHGQLDIGALVVYIAAAWVVMSANRVAA